MLIKKIKSQSKKGFSIIELIVALTLFVSVTALASGSTLTIINSAAQARTSGQAINAITFAVEDLIRNLRLGSEYYCITPDTNFSNLGLGTSNDCDLSDDGYGIAFTGRDNATGYVYYADSTNDSFKKTIADPAVSSNFINLLPSGVNLDSFKVVVEGSGNNDSIQPHVKLAMVFSYVYKGDTYTVPYFTSITSRQLDTL